MSHPDLPSTGPAPAQRRARRRALAGLLAGIVVVTAGCGLREGEPVEIPRSSIPDVLYEDTPAAADASLGRWPADIFLVTGREQALVPMRVSIAPTPDVVRAVLEALIAYAPPAGTGAGTGDEGINLIPAGTTLRSIRRTGDVLDVDLDRFTIEGPSQSRAFAQIVYTATNFQAIAKVRFSIDGEPVGVPLGNRTANPGQALARADFESVVPGSTTTSARPGTGTGTGTRGTTPGSAATTTTRR